MNRNRPLPLLAASLLVLATAACDHSPTSPSPGPSGQGATLNGRFQQGGVAARSQQLGAGAHVGGASALTSASARNATEVHVLASDGSLIASVDIQPDGSFTLRGLPESFLLVFVDADGAPIGEPLEFDAVMPNQEVDIVVAMENGEIVLVEERRTGIDHEGSRGIELEGIVSNLVIGSDPMTGSLDVDGHHVITRAAETSIRKGNRSLTLEDLEEGDRVHVRGVFEGDDVFAHEIKLQEEDEDEPDEEEKVTLCHIPPGNPDNRKTITVGASAVPAHLAHGDYLGSCR